MLTVQKSKNSKDGKVRVTFTTPAIDGCNGLYLVGKFYSWNESTYQMQRADDGTWSLSLELESDHEFQYRFRTNDGSWLEDDASPGTPSAVALLN